MGSQALTTGASILGAVMALRGFRRALRLPALPVGPVSDPLPGLSVILPARNEADLLPRALSSLQAARYPGPFEVIVVDDGSVDGTGSIARHMGARVLRVEGPPPGWLGKPYAAHQGASIAYGEWLLFTDADTWHHPDSPASAVARALQGRWDGLSLFPAFEVRDLLEAAVLAAAFAGLFAALRSFEGLLNGQYILLKRSVYEASGGFATVRNALLEDLALGQHLRAGGWRLTFLDGRRAVRARMSRSTFHLLTAMARWGGGTLEFSGMAGAGAALVVAGSAAPLTVLLQRGWRQSALPWAVVTLGLFPWAHRMGRPEAAFLGPLAAAWVAGASLGGWLGRRFGWGLPWKGRRVL